MILIQFEYQIDVSCSFSRAVSQNLVQISCTLIFAIFIENIQIDNIAIDLIRWYQCFLNSVLLGNKMLCFRCGN